ncbi:hypothetical protein OB236_32260, partial [Paenibacillus sp. WQ 127069]|nr:hypothetical protein [Paenibacillus sp. WQ 127069]
RLGFSYTKATYTLVRADKEKQKQFREVILPELKEELAQEKIDHLLFEDESMIRAYLDLQYNWFPTGQQRKIATHGEHKVGCHFTRLSRRSNCHRARQCAYPSRR